MAAKSSLKKLVKIKDSLSLEGVAMPDNALEKEVFNFFSAIDNSASYVVTCQSPMDALFRATCHRKDVKVGDSSWLHLPDGVTRKDLVQNMYSMVLGPFYSFLTRTFKPEETPALEEHVHLMKHVSVVLKEGSVAFVAPLPAGVHFDEAGFIHNPEGFAIEWSDGFGVYAWHGMFIPWDRADQIIFHPEGITLKSIDEEPNAEIRRAMMEAYGVQKFIKDSGATLVDEGTLEKLWAKEVANDEDIVFLELTNPTPDGIWKDTDEMEVVNLADLMELDPDDLAREKFNSSIRIHKRVFVPNQPLKHSTYLHRVPPDIPRDVKSAMAWFTQEDPGIIDNIDFRA
jgi:hypothetical protein